MGDAAANRQLVERFWQTLYERDFDAAGRYFADDVAVGPARIAARLRLGLEPLSGYYHHPRHIVAEGDLVILEHVEEWQFHTGERILHPFVTVMEVRDGKIVRWHDYSNIGNVIDHAPQWWIERIAQGYAAVGRDAG